MTRRDFTPRPWQVPMIEHMSSVPRCAVWADMGMGKTAGTLTVVDAAFLCGESQPALVVGPLRVARDVWPEEAQKWKHLRHTTVMPIIGSERERRAALKYDASVYTVNYDNLPWLCDRFGDKWPFATVISDEATRLKSLRLSWRTHPKTGKQYVSGQGSQRAKALGRIAHTKIKRFIELTGTPSPNGLANLWGQIWFLDAGARLGRTYEAFRNRWFQRGFDGYNVSALPFAQEQIQDALRDICITIDPHDWFDVKKPIVNNVYVDLPPKARAKYREMEKDMFTKIEKRSVEAFNAAARTQKLLQLANGAVYVDPDADTDQHPRSKEWRELHDAKLAALESIGEEANGMPMLVSYEFRSDLARLLKAFPKGVDLSTETGLARFKAGQAPMGFAHPKSMGHGIEGLQNVTNIITFFGHNWDLELYDQINGRIGPVRQMQSGFDRPVYINHIVARDTVDDVVMARRETKREVQDLLLEAMKRGT